MIRVTKDLACRVFGYFSYACVVGAGVAFICLFMVYHEHVVLVLLSMILFFT